MYYYKMVFRSVPIVGFAHLFKTDHYDISFQPKPSFIEISCIEKGDVIRTDEKGRTELLSAPRILVSLYNSSFAMSSSAPLHSHETVGIHLDYDIHPVNPGEIVACYQGEKRKTPLFAIVTDNIALDEYSLPIQKCIQKIIHTHSIQDSSTALRCTALVIELLAEMTVVCLRSCLIEEKRMNSPGAALYCQRAMNYISAHLNRQIKVQEIARHLGISSGYLSNLFKEFTGRTLIEYINQGKIARIKELMEKGLTLREAGELLCISDEHYLSRIFKKYTGMNARDCRRLISSNEDHGL